MINLVWISNDYFPLLRMKTESETKQIQILSLFVCMLFTRLLLYIWFMRKLNNKGKKDCQLQERDCHYTVHFIVTFLHYSALQILASLPFDENHIQKNNMKFICGEILWTNIWNRRPLVVIVLLLFHVLFLAVIKQPNERNRLYPIEVKRKSGNEL